MGILEGISNFIYPKKITDEKKSAEVLINEPMVITFPWVVNKNPHPTQMWQYFYDNPELNSVLTAIVEDIMSDGYKLYPIKEGESGRNKKLRAEKFLLENHAKETFYNWVMDCLITGDGLLYKMGVSQNYVNKSISNILDKFEIKSFSASELIEEIKAEDEDVFSTKKFQHIPTSTMRASFDKHGDVKKWEQRVAGYTSNFSKEEIIHMRIMRNEGKFYGYTPLYSLQTILDTLKDMRDVLRNDLNGGGIPNSLFVFSGEGPKSDNVLAFAKQLRLFASTNHKHKSLIATTNTNGVQHIKLRESIKDMEYQNLSRYLTQVIVMVWKVPATRLSDLLINSGVKGGGTEDGYYRQISHYQDLIEDNINMYLLKDFGVELKFNRTYLQNEVRETTNQKIKSDVCEQLLSLGIVNEKWAWKYLDIPEDYRGKGYEGSPSKQSGKAYQTVSSLNASPEKQAENNKRQGTQIENMKSEDEKIFSEALNLNKELREKQIKVMNKLLGDSDAIS